MASFTRRRIAFRPTLLPLEDRAAPAVDFVSAFGLAATGTFADIDINDVIVASTGESFITGSFQGTAGFNPQNSASTLTSQGNRDAFVASYTSSNTLRWVTTFAGASSSAVGQGSALAIDGSGNLYLTGSFSGTVDFDPSATTQSLSSPARTDAFVARLNSDGSLAWARQVAGVQGAVDQGLAIAVDSSSGVVVSGAFSGSATFGSTTLQAGGSTDAFVTKLDSAGTFLWTSSTRGTGTSSAEMHGLAVDSSGNVFATGFVAGSVDFDPGPSTKTLVSNGIRDVAVWALTSTGGLAWSGGLGGSDIDQGLAIAIDSQSSIYVSGYFTATVDFDPGASVANLTATGLYDPFVLKLTAAGAYVWARSLAESANGTGQATGLVVDAAGRPMVAGWFSGTLDADPGAAVTNLVASGSTDVFVVALEADGSLNDTRQGGGTDADAAFGLALNASGRVMVAGSTRGPATFGSTNVPLAGTRQAFVAALQAEYPPSAPSAPVLHPASDTGASNTDAVTSRKVLTFQLSGIVPGQTARLLRNGTVVATRVGNGPINDSGSVPDGNHLYTAVQWSPGGLASAASPPLLVTVDSQAPSAPTSIALHTSDDTGTVGDGVTSVRQPRIVGQAEPGSSLSMRTSTNTPLATGTTGLDGQFSLTPSTPLADGLFSILITATDLAGNTSGASSSFALRIDATAPSSPAIPDLFAADDSGVASDRITSNASPRLTGTAEAGSTVRLLDGQGNVRASGLADANGVYLLRITAALADGTYAFTADATDLAGNRSALSASRTIVIDRTAPATPNAPTLLAADDSGTLGDAITNVNRPRFTGLAEANATVELINAIGTVLASATSNAQGNYVLTPSSPLSDGLVTVRVRATDAAGNQGASSAGLTLTIDTVAPAVPPAPGLLAADDSGVLADAITNINTPRITGTAEPLATVRLINASSSVLATGTATTNGSFQLAPSVALADGPVALRVTATDAAGNTSDASLPLSLTIDTVAPAAPTAPALLAADDSGTLGDPLTNVRRPRLTGTAEAGASLRLVDANGTTLGSTQATAQGAYQVAPTTNLSEGSIAVRVIATDAAGNASAFSLATTLTVDATAPVAPTALALLAADDSGQVGDNLTNIARPRVRGTAEVAATVVVSGLGTALTTTADGNGSFTVQPATSLPDGTYQVSARATDAAGNVSVVSTALTLRIVTILPPGPTLTLLAADDSGVAGDGVTITRRPRMIGTTVAGGSVELLDNANQVVGTATAGLDGGFVVAPNVALGVGRNPLAVRVRDVAGNQGTAGTALPINIIVPLGDYGSTGLSALIVLENATATWVIKPPTSAPATSKAYGWAGVDRPIVADFDGDGKSDYLVFRPPSADWYLLSSSTNLTTVRQFGWPGVDLPVPADYDGDGKTDIAVYRPPDARWFILNSSTGQLRTVDFGWTNVDLPIPADYDGDRKADIAVYRPFDGNWFVQQSSNGQTVVSQFGWPNVDLPIPMDFDGDNRADLAVFRPPSAEWFVRSSMNGSTTRTAYGWAGVDVPVPADYDGDGRADLAVFRGPSAEFFVLPSTSGVLQRTILGVPGLVSPVLRPQIYRLSGLRPILSGSFSPQRVGAPAGKAESSATVRPAQSLVVANGSIPRGPMKKGVVVAKPARGSRMPERTQPTDSRSLSWIVVPSSSRRPRFH